MDFKFELGTTLKDELSGFTGVVTGRADYLTGCNTYCLLPKIKESGEYPDSKWLDEGRLGQTSSDIVKLEETEKPGGGPNPPSK